jgi:hypothetical protein
MSWVPSLLERGILRFARKDPMLADVDDTAAIFFPQNIAISRQEDGNGIGKKQYLSRQKSADTVNDGKADLGIF